MGRIVTAGDLSVAIGTICVMTAILLTRSLLNLHSERAYAIVRALIVVLILVPPLVFLVFVLSNW